MRNKLKKQQAGFSLIELILYIALVAVFVIGTILFAWDASYAREKTFQQQAVEQNGRAALARIAYEIRRAQDINSVNTNTIDLENGANDTTITINSGTVQITTGGSGPYDLTSNQVYVTSLTFSQPGSSDEDTKNIDVTISLRQAQTSVSGEFEAQTTLSTSAEVNTQFNHSRQFLINLTDAYLSPNNREILGLTIRNTGTTTLTLDQLMMTWTGMSGTPNVTQVQIGGGSVEWTGSQPPGSTLNLTDYALTTGAGTVNINNISFSSSMASATVNFQFIFSDGSVHKAVVSFAAATPTPTPSPSPTPTPSTCSSYCIGLGGYSGGNCRANSTQCSNNGETYQSGGNPYCTGGGGSDTCCCVPGSTPTPSPSPTPTPTPTPTPSPTPTPTPTPSTCNQYCINGGYSAGTCRANSNQCSNNGESYLSGGNPYCTGGGGADTCCCAP